MNWVDFIIVVAAIVFALEGFRQGFFAQAINLVGFIVSLIAALISYSFFANLLMKLFHLPPIAANPIGFLIVWIMTETVFFGILSAYFKKIHTAALTPVNKYLGFVPAVVNALLFSSFVLLFVISLPINPIIKKDIFTSKIASELVKQVAVLERPLNNVFGPITKQGLTFLTVKPEERGTVDLKFTQDELTIDYASEKAMLEMVNAE